jgi:hypothetical protein
MNFDNCFYLAIVSAKNFVKKMKTQDQFQLEHFACITTMKASCLKKGFCINSEEQHGLLMSFFMLGYRITWKKGQWYYIMG